MTLQSKVLPRPGILDIAPYVGGAAEAPGANRVFKLSSNENPLGASPAVREAYRSVADHLHIYPDGGHLALRSALGELHGIDAGRIVCGAGSDELIALLCKAYAGPGDQVLYSAHGFLMYRLSALSAGAEPVAAPETELTADIDALLAAVTYRTRLVFLANPNNPTGTMVPDAEIARLAESLPPQALLVLDSAYAEYVPGYDGGAALVGARDNVVMLRTFSKIYGLGALRLGWCYGPAHVIDVLNRVRGPFNVGAPALIAGEAAVRDQAWISKCVAENAEWRDWMSAAIRELGYPVVPSHGNFVIAQVGERAPEIEAFLKGRGVLVRSVASYGLPDYLRITIGDGDGCRAVAEGLAAWKAEAGA